MILDLAPYVLNHIAKVHRFRNFFRKNSTVKMRCLFFQLKTFCFSQYFKERRNRYDYDTKVLHWKIFSRKNLIVKIE